MSKTVLHKRSVAVVNGKPKLPTSAQTEYGEIAINYAKGYETLSIKNNQNEIVTFSSYDQIKNMLDDSELVIASALNDLNSRVNEISANTTGNTGIEYTAGTNIDITDHVISVTGITVPITSITLNGASVTVSGGVANLGNLMDEHTELVMTAALNDLNTRLNASTGLITGVTLNGSALTINEGVVDLGNLMDEDDDLVIAEALVDLNNKITGITGVIEENELNTAAAVNDLYDKVDENEYLTSQAITQLESRIKELETALAGVEQILASI